MRDPAALRSTPSATLIAILDDDPLRRDAMEAALRDRSPDVRYVFFDNAPDCLGWLDAGLSTAALISLDHDLGPVRDRDGERFDPGIGREVVDALETMDANCPVLIHSSNGPAAEGMLYALQFAGWTAERVYPHNDLEWIRTDWIERVMAHLPDPG